MKRGFCKSERDSRSHVYLRFQKRKITSRRQDVQNRDKFQKLDAFLSGAFDPKGPYCVTHLKSLTLRGTRVLRQIDMAAYVLIPQCSLLGHTRDSGMGLTMNNLRRTRWIGTFEIARNQRGSCSPVIFGNPDRNRRSIARTSKGRSDQEGTGDIAPGLVALDHVLGHSLKAADRIAD
jgi:hypothetical protein